MISIQWTSSISDDGTCTYIGKSDLQDFTIVSRGGVLISMEPQIQPAPKTSLEAIVAVESMLTEINARDKVGLSNELND